MKEARDVELGAFLAHEELKEVAGETAPLLLGVVTLNDSTAEGAGDESTRSTAIGATEKAISVLGGSRRTHTNLVSS